MDKETGITASEGTTDVILSTLNLNQKEGGLKTIKHYQHSMIHSKLSQPVSLVLGVVRYRVYPSQEENVIAALSHCLVECGVGS